jgi:hypothetical protein
VQPGRHFLVDPLIWMALHKTRGAVKGMYIKDADPLIIQISRNAAGW